MTKAYGVFFTYLFLIGSATISAQETATYRDEFNTVSYDNNNGSRNFATDWIEGDDGGSPANGSIQVVSGRFRFENIDTRFAHREVNLDRAISASVSFDYDATARGDEILLVLIWDRVENLYYQISEINTSTSNTVSINLTAAQITSRTNILFFGNDFEWDAGETIFIDNVQFTAEFDPIISIDNKTIDEAAGTVTIDATHVGGNTSDAFSVVYTSMNGTAISGSDYTNVNGTLNFSGSVGDSQSITIPITDDAEFENGETFTVSFTSSSDPNVDISETATITITDNDVIGNTPLALFEELDGYIDYATIGGSLRTASNEEDPCAISASSSGVMGVTVPSTATVKKALLYWAHSGSAPDSEVIFEGSTVNADIMYTSSINVNVELVFYGGVSDVTAIVKGVPDPFTNTYDFSGLAVDNGGNYCASATVLGGWSLIIIYEDDSLPASTVNLYQGFNGESNSASSFTLDGFFAIGNTGTKTTIMSWEGDQNLNSNELLTVTSGAGTFTLAGDGDNDGTTVNNPFNSTIYDNTITPVINIATSYGIDLDTHDLSPYIAPGETSLTTTIMSGTDYVIMNAVVLKVASNLITGTVFEDVNYGSGAGRNFLDASGVGINAASVELYDSTETLIGSTVTDTDGIYVFSGMNNGSYRIRVVNTAVRSTRGGGSACTTCIPIQTFRNEYSTESINEIANEVGGADPSSQDATEGTLTGAQTQSIVNISSEGIVDVDFGFNFNTIVNTNAAGQGSLKQFIINSNNLDETGLNIEANSIFDPGVGDDTSIFMIPSTADPLGRNADTNFANGFFSISIPNSISFTNIQDNNTHIDGRTQTAYTGNTNTGSAGAGGISVGTSSTILPVYERPEIQIYRPGGDVFKVQGTNTVVRNLSVSSNNNSAVRIQNGSATISHNFLGTNARGEDSGNIDTGVEITGGNVIIESNYVSGTTDQGIWINGGTSTLVRNNDISLNGNGACNDNIRIASGSGIVIQMNLLAQAASLGVDLATDGVTITENTIINNGLNGGDCGAGPQISGIKVSGNNSSISNNIITANAGAGILVTGGTTSGNLISKNSIYANGTVSPALGIDISNDGVTLNDMNDLDNGPNGSLNFPIISGVYMSATNIVVEGWSRPETIIELFLTDVSEGTASGGDNRLDQSTDYGEGQRYLGSFTEGSIEDTDTTNSTYLDLDGNKDATNRFRYSIPLSSGISRGSFLTTTATLANSTSEFSPQSIVISYSVITNRRITHRVRIN